MSTPSSSFGEGYTNQQYSQSSQQHPQRSQQHGTGGYYPQQQQQQTNVSHGGNYGHHPYNMTPANVTQIPQQGQMGYGYYGAPHGQYPPSQMQSPQQYPQQMYYPQHQMSPPGQQPVPQPYEYYGQQPHQSSSQQHHSQFSQTPQQLAQICPQQSHMQQQHYSFPSQPKQNQSFVDDDPFAFVDGQLQANQPSLPSPQGMSFDGFGSFVSAPAAPNSVVKTQSITQDIAMQSFDDEDFGEFESAPVVTTSVPSTHPPPMVSDFEQNVSVTSTVIDDEDFGEFESAPQPSHQLPASENSQSSIAVISTSVFTSSTTGGTSTLMPSMDIESSIGDDFSFGDFVSVPVAPVSASVEPVASTSTASLSRQIKKTKTPILIEDDDPFADMVPTVDDSALITLEPMTLQPDQSTVSSHSGAQAPTQTQTQTQGSSQSFVAVTPEQHIHQLQVYVSELQNQRQQMILYLATNSNSDQVDVVKQNELARSQLQYVEQNIAYCTQQLTRAQAYFQAQQQAVQPIQYLPQSIESPAAVQAAIIDSSKSEEDDEDDFAFGDFASGPVASSSSVVQPEKISAPIPTAGYDDNDEHDVFAAYVVAEEPEESTSEYDSVSGAPTPNEFVFETETGLGNVTQYRPNPSEEVPPMSVVLSLPPLSTIKNENENANVESEQEDDDFGWDGDAEFVSSTAENVTSAIEPTTIQAQKTIVSSAALSVASDPFDPFDVLVEADPEIVEAQFDMFGLPEPIVSVPRPISTTQQQSAMVSDMDENEGMDDDFEFGFDDATAGSIDMMTSVAPSVSTSTPNAKVNSNADVSVSFGGDEIDDPFAAAMTSIVTTDDGFEEGQHATTSTSFGDVKDDVLDVAEDNFAFETDLSSGSPQIQHQFASVNPPPITVNEEHDDFFGVAMNTISSENNDADDLWGDGLDIFDTAPTGTLATEDVVTVSDTNTDVTTTTDTAEIDQNDEFDFGFENIVDELPLESASEATLESVAIVQSESEPASTLVTEPLDETENFIFAFDDDFPAVTFDNVGISSERDVKSADIFENVEVSEVIPHSIGVAEAQNHDEVENFTDDLDFPEDDIDNPAEMFGFEPVSESVPETITPGSADTVAEVVDDEFDFAFQNDIDFDTAPDTMASPVSDVEDNIPTLSLPSENQREDSTSSIVAPGLVPLSLSNDSSPKHERIKSMSLLPTVERIISYRAASVELVSTFSGSEETTIISEDLRAPIISPNNSSEEVITTALGVDMDSLSIDADALGSALPSTFVSVLKTLSESTISSTDDEDEDSSSINLPSHVCALLLRTYTDLQTLYTSLSSTIRSLEAKVCAVNESAINASGPLSPSKAILSVTSVTSIIKVLTTPRPSSGISTSTILANQFLTLTDLANKALLILVFYHASMNGIYEDLSSLRAVVVSILTYWMAIHGILSRLSQISVQYSLPYSHANDETDALLRACISVKSKKLSHVEITQRPLVASSIVLMSVMVSLAVSLLTNDNDDISESDGVMATDEQIAGFIQLFISSTPPPEVSLLTKTQLVEEKENTMYVSDVHVQLPQYVLSGCAEMWPDVASVFEAALASSLSKE